MEITNIDQLNASSQNLDHHGIVAATCMDIGLVEKIDLRIGSKDPRRIVNPGHAVKAMLINGLGFTNRRLYLSPQFFETKPVDKLISPSIKASHLDDHALGEALDDIAEYGPSRLFGEVAFEIGMEQKLFGKTAHLDSTSFSVEGEYPETLGEGVSAIRVTHGYSKDHRPDLKQVMMSLCTSGKADFPFWIEPQSGNASDKAEFDKIILKVNAFKQQLKEGAPTFRYVCDSALYSKEGVLSHNQYLWISRVPETLSEAKKIVSRDQDSWSETKMPGYQITPLRSDYGSIEQRWILVYSEQAYQRERKTFEKNLIKKTTALNKELWHLGNQVYGCSEDIEKELIKLRKKYSLHTIEVKIEPVLKHSKKGRPDATAEKVIKGYKLIASAALNSQAVEAKLKTKGRFILATNDLDQESLSDEQILTEYKDQQGVERGFRFLKDPWFMVDSIFLKSERRIAALMMVMALCLMVFNIAQHRLRERLRETNQTITNQLGKPSQTPTLRWIFQIMEGICKVTISLGSSLIKTQITNLNELRIKIIALFGPTAQLIYSSS